jgi:hypothetical protein
MLPSLAGLCVLGGGKGASPFPSMMSRVEGEGALVLLCALQMGKLRPKEGQYLVPQ